MPHTDLSGRPSTSMLRCGGGSWVPTGQRGSRPGAAVLARTWCQSRLAMLLAVGEQVEVDRLDDRGRLVVGRWSPPRRSTDGVSGGPVFPNNGEMEGTERSRWRNGGASGRRSGSGTTRRAAGSRTPPSRTATPARRRRSRAPGCAQCAPTPARRADHRRCPVDGGDDGHRDGGHLGRHRYL
jgi:hypothetical protein